MDLIKRLLSTLFHLTIGYQETIKLKENVKGIYRYPSNMIGRNVSSSGLDKTDILVFATHPDDEILGLSAIMARHRHRQEEVTVVYVTDGSGRGGSSWKRKKELSEKIAEERYEEGVRALSVLKIPQQNLISMGFPDGGTHRYLKELSGDVASLIKITEPNKIYVHCIEGGHNDHDLVSLVVKSICNQLNFQNVFEWAEYSPLYPLGTKNMNFLSPLPFHKEKEIKINLTKDELISKKKMLACHRSQDVTDYYNQGEIIRKANVKNYNEELNAYSQVMKEDWSYLVEKYIKYLREQENNKPAETKSIGKQTFRKL